MSVFRVKLTQGDSRTGDGNLDTNAQAHTYSIQRTMYAMGPGKINRKLKDGDTFTDCNYWKRFTYPTLPYNEAFIEVVTDDGAVYVDGHDSLFLRTYSQTVTGGTSLSSGYATIDVLGDNGGPAEWVTITPTADVLVRFNGVSTTDFTATASNTITFNRGDIIVNTIQLAKTTSASATAVVQVGVFSKCNS